MPRGYLNRGSTKLTKAEIGSPVSSGKIPQEKERGKGLGLLRNFDWSKQWESAYRTLPGTPWRHKRKKSNSNSRRRSSYDHRESLASIHSLSKNGNSNVFGVPLARLVLESNSQVPFLVSDVVSFLSTRGLEEEGLFRVSGNARIIEKIRCCIEKDGCPVDFTPFEDDIAAVASILKTFLRELPEAVIPISVHAMFIRAQADNEQNVEQCVWELRELVNAIPDAERDLLVYLCGFLRTVADHIDTTKMTAKALGIVFGPNLFRCSGGLEGLKEQTYTNHIVEKFILYHGDIFTELNFSSVPTSSCDSLDEPRPASADSILMAERERVCRDVRRPQRLSRTPEGWCVDSASRRQSAYRQSPHLSTGPGSGGRPVEYHVNHPKLCGVNSNSSCSSSHGPLSPPPFVYQAIVPSTNPAPAPSREAMMRPIDIDVSPWRVPRKAQHRYSAVLPGRVRNVVDRWEGGRTVDDTDASISADNQVYDSAASSSAAFSRNLNRRPRVAIPSVFLEDTKRKFEDQRGGAKDCDTPSRSYSSPASNILDDIIRFLESSSPVKTSGDVSSGYMPGRNKDSAALSETTDSSFRSLDFIGARESGRRQKQVASAKAYSVSSDDSLHCQLSNPAEAMTLSAGAHVQRARSLRTEARAARKQFSPLLQNDHKVTPRLPRRSPHSFSAGSPVPPGQSVQKQRRSRSDSSSRSEDAGVSAEERPKAMEKRGLRRNHGRAASFRHPPVVARRMPRVSSIERRKVQSLPPLELDDDGDSEGCGEEAGRYLGQKRKRRQDKVDDIRLDADLLQLLREVQHSRQLASRESRNSNRDSSHATDEAGSKVAFSSRNSTPRQSGSRQHPGHTPRSTPDSYGNYHQPPASNKAQRWAASTHAATTKPHRGSYEARAARGARTPSSQEDQIRQVVNYISAKLTMKRTLGHRPSEFKDMTGDQLLSEKKNIQKCLLQYEAQFGRPNTEAERQLMRPLYEQYRIVKKYLQLASCSMRYCDSPRRDSASTVASGRQGSSVFSELESPGSTRHSRQSRPSQTYVENFVHGGMIQPTVQSHSNITVSSFGSIHSPSACHSPGSVHQMQFMRGGMVAASAAVPMTSPTVLSQPMPTHATVVQSPLWWTTSLQRANRAELLDLQLQVLLEKGQLRRLLKTFEEEFHRHTGRKITKNDRGRMTAEYDRYKYCKAQLKLLDALLSKPAAADGQQIAV